MLAELRIDLISLRDTIKDQILSVLARVLEDFPGMIRCGVFDAVPALD